MRSEEQIFNKALEVMASWHFENDNVISFPMIHKMIYQIFPTYDVGLIEDRLQEELDKINNDEIDKIANEVNKK